jgi:hypothetical protein
MVHSCASRRPASDKNISIHNCYHCTAVNDLTALTIFYSSKVTLLMAFCAAAACASTSTSDVDALLLMGSCTVLYLITDEMCSGRALPCGNARVVSHLCHDAVYFSIQDQLVMLTTLHAQQRADLNCCCCCFASLEVVVTQQCVASSKNLVFSSWVIR